MEKLVFLERQIMQIENKWANLKWEWAWNGHDQLKVGEQIRRFFIFTFGLGLHLKPISTSMIT